MGVQHWNSTEVLHVWEEHRLRVFWGKQQGNGENCIMRNFMICMSLYVFVNVIRHIKISREIFEMK